MPANSMGRINCEAPARSQRPQGVPTGVVGACVAPADASGATAKKGRFAMPVCKGVLAALFYSLCFAAVPLVDHYADLNYASDGVRAGVIAGSVAAALFLVMANDCVAWFNMVLYFHLGVEIIVLDTLFSYADAAGSGDRETALAYAAAAVIALHLVPFFLLDRSDALLLLAGAGVVANASSLVFVEPTLLLIAFGSSCALLLAVLLIASIDCVRPSLLSQLRGATSRGAWLRAADYQT